MKNFGKYFWKFADGLDWVVWKALAVSVVVFITGFIFGIKRPVEETPANNNDVAK